MLEIEVKLNYSDKNKIIEKLKELNAEEKEAFILEDKYFGFNNMSNFNNLLRIRNKNNDFELSFKGKCKENNKIWQREELTIKIEDPNAMERILLVCGAKKIKENSSKRELWILNNLEIVFIDFLKPAKLNLLELEGPEQEINSLLKQLNGLVQRVGEEVFAEFDEIE